MAYFLASLQSASPRFIPHLRRLGCLGSLLLLALVAAPPAFAQLAIRGKQLYTMAGEPIRDGVVLITNGKITAVGKAAAIAIPAGYETLSANVVTPGLVDVHATVGLSGILNQDEDQDQLENSQPIQPELRAIDAYNARDPLVTWLRELGVTTVHTGHAPGELISGQTLIVKTWGNSVEEALVRPGVAVAASLVSQARKDGPKAPGTRGKMVAMLRSELIRAREYLAQQQPNVSKDGVKDAVKGAATDAEAAQPPAAADATAPARDLRLETLAAVLEGKLPLMITADRAQDISSALRLASEFKFRLWLDSAAEAYLLIPELQAAKVPVLLHSTMARAVGDRENLSLETAGKLRQAGILLGIQSGYEPYVPKTRVVLWEAALAAAHGLTREQALAAITIDAAKILGIDRRVGSLEVGKDADVALYDGDPLEYTSHCVGVVIGGQVVSREKR